MLKSLFDRLARYLLTSVYGSYAHPYTLTLLMPRKGLAYNTKQQINFIGSHNGAVELAKKHLSSGTAIHCDIHTRGGVKTWEGSC